jgi:hypothetical protein
MTNRQLTPRLETWGFPLPKTFVYFAYFAVHPRKPNQNPTVSPPESGGVLCITSITWNETVPFMCQKEEFIGKFFRFPSTNQIKAK